MIEVKVTQSKLRLLYVMPAANCCPLSEIILSGNLCNFQMLSLNNSSMLVLSVVSMKCTIFVNLSTTTKIESYP